MSTPTDEGKNLDDVGVLLDPIIDACAVEKVEFSLLQDMPG